MGVGHFAQSGLTTYWGRTTCTKIWSC